MPKSFNLRPEIIPLKQSKLPVSKKQNAEEEPTPLKMREELIKLVREDLLGPKGGPNEILPPEESSVIRRYLVGILAPGGKINAGDINMDQSDDDIEPDVSETKADNFTVLQEEGSGESVEREPVLVDSLLPSSAGFSCLIAPEENEIVLHASWGRYKKVASKEQKDKKVWQRQPVNPESVVIHLREETGYKQIETNVALSWRIRKREDAWHFTVFIINTAEKQKKDEHWLFQVALKAQSADGQPVFLPRQRINKNRDLMDAEERMEMENLDLRYRHCYVFGKGHGAALKAQIKDDPARAVAVELDFLPDINVHGQTARTDKDEPLLKNIILDMKELAEMPQDELCYNLKRLADAYSAWVEKLPEGISDPTFKDAVERAQAEAGRAVGRLKEGIDTLANDKDALEAFRFANRAMHLQRVRSIFARDVKAGKAPQEKKDYLKKLDTPENRSWRLFQLAFILGNIPTLANPLHAERSGDKAVAQLLWFTTGGGKTEAYLGLTAFTLAMRRLRSNLGGLDAEHGVAVLMRYTLRLLTLQQFQRAAALICACENLRRENPKLWGKEPFRLGLWVGSQSTPNTLKQAEENRLRTSFGSGGSPLQFSYCPWCGSPINENNVSVKTSTGSAKRCLTFCGDDNGLCLFTARQSPQEGLPVMVVDEEIYRRPPSLLISTVDKFARMPWKGEVEMLFGRVTGYCPRHGFVSPDVDEEPGKTHIKCDGFAPAKISEHGWLRPPDLIIQDELHLISGPLGSMTALYENAVDTLCQWEIDGKTVRPKVIASTATIHRAGEQIHRLFDRRVEVFPPPGVDSGDNFFSLERPVSDDSPGRVYMGICAPGVRLPPTMVRVYATVMGAAQHLYNKYGEKADAWMTNIGYFNSIRELAGMNRLVRDEVRGRLKDSKNTRGLAARENIRSEELTSRQPSRNIPQILETMGHSIEAKEARKGFYDVVLATNMISVGVDIERLGLMVIEGQPKNTSEYIQASSRVGRSKNAPGLVLTVYNWARPRDLSHFEDFYGYHAAFQRYVEALSITPFASRALDRGLAAVLVSLIRLLDTEMNGNESAKMLPEKEELFKRASDFIVQRAIRITENNTEINNIKEMLEKLREEWLAKAQNGQVSGLAYERTSKAVGLLSQASISRELFACLNSLRDVEKTVDLILNEDKSGLSV